jgi:phosphonate transport system ATP-binding protein
MLEILQLTKRFGTATAVRDVSVEIPAGQMVGVIGRSGAGKSTLLRMLNRLEDNSEGSIRFKGRDVSALRGRELLRWRSRCAMIFQQFNLVPRLDVLTNVLLGRIANHGTVSSLFKRFTDAERAMAILALERLDMADKALQRADTLSGGQQQRVAIARAMMQQPELLLADEPIASLDPRSAAMVMDALRRINQEDGITVICNLHTLDTARQYCDRIIAMFHGEVVFDDVPEALTQETVRRIYGVEEGESVREELTSNSGWIRPGHIQPQPVFS